MTASSLSSIRALILDIDGVLWRGDQPIGNLPAVFATIQLRGWQVRLATNNSTRLPEQYVEKLRSFGVESLQPGQVINSAHATAYYLHRRFPQGGPLYVIGEEGVRRALTAQGFFFSETEPLAVVAGMDRQLTFDMLERATLLIRAGAPFIATNPDRTFPMPYGLIPGAGAILAALETATDVKPFVVGKPSPEMYRLAIEQMGVTPQQTLGVGDRLETDVAGAQALGCHSGLVLSGVTTEAEARAWQPAPDWIAADLSALLDMI